ncbi:MAG: cobalamin-dependent protein [Desulfobacterales bacterium]|nr:cobalamin-dependent protein [Desulfobacterales bacterium]
MENKATIDLETNSYQEYLSSLLAGDRIKCSQIIDNFMQNKIAIKNLYENIFQLSLYKIGELWECNKISVAHEHMATSITESIMNQIYPNLISPKRTKKKAVISSVENELHQVGGKMAADIFEMHGWDSFYLGANTPLTELIRFVNDINPDVIGLSLTVYFHLENLKNMLNILTNKFRNIKILVGGQALKFGVDNILKSYENVIYIKSLDSLENCIKNFGE